MTKEEIIKISIVAGVLFVFFTFGDFFDGLLNALMPMYGVVAFIGFAVMYVLWRDEHKENEKLQNKIDDHLCRWGNLSKEEGNTKKE